LLAACLFDILPAQAGGLAIQPVRVFLDPGRTTQSIQVRNESDVALPLQLRAYEWSQDEQGRDAYRPTTELIFFPRMLTLAPGEQRIVRIGVRGMAPEGEHTYRLYLEELPEPATAPLEGLRTVLRVGVPVFRRPSSLAFAGEVIGLDLRDCRVSFRVANRGNAHLMLQAVSVSAFDRRGRQLADAGLKGWYVLAGRERPFTHTLPEDVCRNTRRLRVNAVSDQASFEGVADAPF
jgi:fimbrial chaperone protein